MRALEKRRQAHRVLAMRALGVNVDLDRIWSSQVAAAGREGDISRLPVAVDRLTSNQDAQGEPVFMFGYSAFGGGDPMSAPAPPSSGGGTEVPLATNLTRSWDWEGGTYTDGVSSAALTQLGAPAPTVVPGVGGGDALRFDQSRLYVEGDTALHGSGPLTICAFARANYAYGGQHYYAAVVEAPGFWFGWEVRAPIWDEPVQYQFALGGRNADGTWPDPDYAYLAGATEDEWFFWRLTVDGNTLRLRINEDPTREITLAVQGVFQDPAGWWQVARPFNYYDPGQTWQEVDQLRVWSRILTDAEGQWLRNGGNGRTLAEIQAAGAVLE